MSRGALKLGLIGAGRWGRNFIKAIAAQDGVSLHRLASRNPDSRGLVPGRCIISEHWPAVATAEDLDGVIIATPPAHHAEMAAAAIAAGNPVLIEKPLTMDVAQARALLTGAEKKAAIVLVDHIHLYHPAYVELKRRGQALGHLRALRSAGGDWGPFRTDAPVLWDRASHDVALCLDLLAATPENVAARRLEGRQTAEGYGETLAIELNFAGGLVARIEAGNLMTAKKRFLAANYDNETLIYDDLCDDPLVRQAGADGQSTEAIPVVEASPLDRVLQAFAAAIRGGESDISGLELGLRVVETLAACEAALRSGGKALNSLP